MKRIAFALLVCALPAAASEALRIEHFPPGEVPAMEPLALTAKVENAHRLAALELHWRARGGSWRTVAFGKDPQGAYAAIIEAREVRPPAIEYYLSAQERGGPEVDRFASAAAPHPILVRAEPGEMERESRLLNHRGHTSSAIATVDYVDFGSHGGFSDRYYVAESSYEYRILSFVQHVRLGIGTLRGDVPPPNSFSGGIGEKASRHTGLDYGYGELAFNLSDRIGFTGKLLLGADDLGFSTGASGMLRIGEETAAHVEIGAQIVQRFGAEGWLRLVWDTVPRWPIGFSVHVTDMPRAPVPPSSSPQNPITDRGAPAGIRAILDAGFQATEHVTILAKAGYQARFSTDGGATFVGGVQVER